MEQRITDAVREFIAEHPAPYVAIECKRICQQSGVWHVELAGLWLGTTARTGGDFDEAKYCKDMMDSLGKTTGADVIVFGL